MEDRLKGFDLLDRGSVISQLMQRETELMLAENMITLLEHQIESDNKERDRLKAVREQILKHLENLCDEVSIYCQKCDDPECEPHDPMWAYYQLRNGICDILEKERGYICVNRDT